MNSKLLSQVSAYIGRNMGLHYPPDRYSELEARLLRMIPEKTVEDADDFFEQLIHRPFTYELRNQLATSLTVGETYFFRSVKLFEELEKILDKVILKRRKENHLHLNIWSAGCSTGEEPYSIAMTLLHLLPDILDWNISILGTDINPVSLKKAEKAMYSEWSFRNCKENLKTMHFIPRKDRWEVTQNIREMVRFRFLNLIRDPFPSLSSSIIGEDVIFCKNVMMYFDETVQNCLIDRLFNTLVEGGCLVVDPVEYSASRFSNFTSHRVKDYVFYLKQRKEIDTVKEISKSPPLKIKKTIKKPVFKTIKVSKKKAVTDLVEPVKTAEKLVLEDLLKRAKELANLGKHEEALKATEQYQKVDKATPESYYTRSMIYLALGQQENAKQELEKLMFLASDHLMGSFHLACLYKSAGKNEAVNRQWKFLKAGLKKLDSDELVPDSDGMSAERLLELVEIMSNDK